MLADYTPQITEAIRYGLGVVKITKSYTASVKNQFQVSSSFKIIGRIKIFHFRLRYWLSLME